jgi:hypothetical protein
VVDGGGLENRCTRKGTGGSNPSPSANLRQPLASLAASVGKPPKVSAGFVRRSFSEGESAQREGGPHSLIRIKREAEAGNGKLAAGS